MRRVVVTGMGIYSVLGIGTEAVLESLKKGKSGIDFFPYRKEMGFRSGLSGSIESPNLKGKLPRRSRVNLAQQGEYAFVSTDEALKNANINEDFLKANEVGVIFGNDSSGLAVVDSWERMKEKKDTSLIGSGHIFRSMNSTVSMNLSVIFKLRGINLTISSACSSGSHSIGLGYHLIKSGLQNTIVCGGAQEVNPESMGTFDGLNAFSIREDKPQEACSPFDKNRDGLVPSGGAATVILEDYDQAVKRGATILGEIIGFGFSSNGDHISVPNVDGPYRSMIMSLKDAGVSPAEIDYVNAHATSTVVGDSVEAQAIDKVFGDCKPPVSSTKSMTGHEMWMAGASEVVYSLLMMHNDFIAPNINLKEPDEFAAKLNIVRETKKAKLNTILSNSFGFGGTNSALVLRRV